MDGELLTLAERHGVDRRFDDPNAYGRSQSYYGDGKYPPDWSARREAVWEYQSYQCGRCRVYKGDADVSEVHHVRHLQDGGANALDNLVGLCGDCHSLMHPDVGALRGDYRRSAVYPATDARDQVSVVREPSAATDGGGYDPDAWREDLRRLGAVSSPEANRHAVSAAAIPTSPTVARRAREFQSLLVEHGLVPRTTDYHRVAVVPQFPGLRGALTGYRPGVSSQSDAAAATTTETDGGERLRYTEDATGTTVTVSGPDDEGGRHELHLAEYDSGDGARVRVEQRVSPPPVSAGTLPDYLVGAAKYFLLWPLVTGLLAVFALMVFSVVTLPTSPAGVLGTAVLAGNALRLPLLVRDVLSDPETSVVDERAEG